MLVRAVCMLTKFLHSFMLPVKICDHQGCNTALHTFSF
jgi:hypothetical protein